MGGWPPLGATRMGKQSTLSEDIARGGTSTKDYNLRGLGKGMDWTNMGDKSEPIRPNSEDCRPPAFIVLTMGRSRISNRGGGMVGGRHPDQEAPILDGQAHQEGAKSYRGDTDTGIMG